MPELLKSLQAYAAHLDTVEPVTAQEARDRGDLPTYYPDQTLRPRPAHRRRWPHRAAAVIVVCLGAAITWNATRPPTPSPAPLFLPATVPAGLQLAYKATASPAPHRVLARLAPATDATRGWIEVTVEPSSEAVRASDFADAVDINGQNGTTSFPPGQPAVVTWTDGASLYSVSGVGAATDQLVAVARSVRQGGDTYTVVAPPRWTTLPLVPLPDSAVTLGYADDGIGLVRVTVYADGGEIVDQIRSFMPNATIARQDDQELVMTERGTDRIVYRKVGDGGYVMAVASDVSDPVTTALVGSITEVNGGAWDTLPMPEGHPIPYQPDPAAYAPVVTTATAQLDAQPGPNNSWCLRPVPAPANDVAECLTATNAASIRVADVADAGTASRAAYGSVEKRINHVVITLDDGTRVDAILATLPGADQSAWIATFPADRRVRNVEATDPVSHLLFRAGPH